MRPAAGGIPNSGASRKPRLKPGACEGIVDLQAAINRYLAETN
jgi:hypothetical protein